MKKRRFWISLVLNIAGLFVMMLPVLAVPGTISNLTASPSDTEIILTWSKSQASDTTRVRFLTSGFPTDPTGAADGSTSIYFSSGNTYTHTGLTSGRTYYYTVWAYDGAYSAGVNIAMSTQSVGDEEDSLATPTLPNDYFQKPDVSSWHTKLQPFTGFIDWFNTAFNMPQENVNYSFGVMILVFVGISLYIKTRSVMIGIASDIALDFGLVGIHLMPGWSIVLLVVVGLGAWGMEYAMS